MTHSVEIRSIAHGAALRLVTLALAHAEARGWTIAVAVLDAQGLPLATLRMAGASALVAENALDKAWTAVMLKRSTKSYGERLATEPDFARGAASRDRLLAWEGGLPVRERGVLIGGIGVSGAKGHEDAECGEVALAALGLASEG